MKTAFCFLLKLGISVVFLASTSWSYGLRNPHQDDAIELKQLLQATAAIVKNDDFVNAELFDFNTNYKMCSPVFMGPEKLWSTCSAVLIAEDLLLTAGHCIQKSTCSERKIVFDFKDNDSIDHYRKNPKQAYACKKVVYHSAPVPQKQLVDFAIIQLDRPVLDRRPIKISGFPLQGAQKIQSLGHPLGLPQKVVEGFVSPSQSLFNLNSKSPFYKVSMNSFNGLSGGPLFDESYNFVGLVVRGDGNFEKDNRCVYIRNCDLNDCPSSEIQKINSTLIKSILRKNSINRNLR